jgi:hypothetical protein
MQGAEVRQPQGISRKKDNKTTKLEKWKKNTP